jgi:hypothetical protein
MALKDDFADLETRLTRVESHLGLKSPEEEQADQEARDKALLATHPTTYAEAIAQEQARARLEGREPNVDVADPEETPDGAERTGI